MFRWIKDLISTWRSIFPKKDQHGRIKGFLYDADNSSIADFHSSSENFGRRVFISFERSSLPLAEKFETALKAFKLEPWRYEPSDFVRTASNECFKIPESMTNQLEQFKPFRDDMRKLEATFRRCTAAIFLISERSLNSAACEIEAMSASSIHGAWPDGNSAPVYVILEKPDLSPPVWLQKFWKRVYSEGLEESMAALIAEKIEVQAIKLKFLEEARAKIYRPTGK